MDYITNQKSKRFREGVAELVSQRETFEKGIIDIISKGQYNKIPEILDIVYEMSYKIYIRGQQEELVDKLKEGLSLIDILTEGVEKEDKKKKNKKVEEKEHYTVQFARKVLFFAESLKYFIIDKYKEQPTPAREGILKAFKDHYAQKVETHDPKQLELIINSIKSAYQEIDMLSIPDDEKEIELMTFEFRIKETITKFKDDINNKIAENHYKSEDSEELKVNEAYANETKEDDKDHNISYVKKDDEDEEKIKEKLDNILDKTGLHPPK